MKKEKCKCQTLQSGDIIEAREVYKGSVCAYCGRFLHKLDWDNVPLYRKIIRWIKYKINPLNQ